MIGAPPLAAVAPPESHGRDRSDVRLLVSRAGAHTHHRFPEIVDMFRPGDVFVVNESSAWPASLPAVAGFGRFRLNLSTGYGSSTWLAEPRWGPARPGPLPLRSGDIIRVAGLSAEILEEYPGVPRLRFVRFTGDLARAAWRHGEPIRYGYAAGRFPLSAYQTVFSRIPGSAEMPSASRPFTPALLGQLLATGVQVVPILLHAGVSSFDSDDPNASPVVYPEPFQVPLRTAEAINAARGRGSKVIAIGTTVLRALESAYRDGSVRPTSGFTRLRIDGSRRIRSVDGLLSGFHNLGTSHLAMLQAVLGGTELRGAYDAALRQRYLWHEFGDSHLLLPAPAPREAG
ncbi:MAG: S-adenosylmethionine:tRNA ribosyltransferase-isomerase [Thermoplasmata archaeon]|nr:S-adenosylmethionine:tRNA ribosyltransferase-isomerase [Thermoplasmata archaeon]